jgi:hypothetical protein
MGKEREVDRPLGCSTRLCLHGRLQRLGGDDAVHLCVRFVHACRYMERQLRENIGFTGTPLRIFWRGKPERERRSVREARAGNSKAAKADKEKEKEVEGSA